MGPTGVGKTELALRVAERYGSPVVSCDSRQIYRDLPIGTAAPTAEEQARVKHYFIGTHELEQDYSAGQYERDALRLLEELFRTHEVVVMTGGSMLYADAVCHGLDELPAVPASIRADVQRGYETGGLKWLQAEVSGLLGASRPTEPRPTEALRGAEPRGRKAVFDAAGSKDNGQWTMDNG